MLDLSKPKKANFAKRAQPGFIVGIGDGTKVYQVFVPKDHIVVTTQHIRTIETLDSLQNHILERQYLRVDENTNAESAAPDETEKLTPSITRASTKSTWTRERPFTRSRQIHATEAGTGVVSNVKDADPSNYRDAIKIVDKNEWEAAMQEELQALENNQVWKMVEHHVMRIVCILNGFIRRNMMQMEYWSDTRLVWSRVLTNRFLVVTTTSLLQLSWRCQA
uniref:AlNc14C357G10957 protein n=1 Tax=Albugo laibachii Nc14 TaxID=890382 RepID=F0WXK6_9STRA|nr:AlNc14C357G10957 [Albugo laibachii Nc14]|eukprot:CCA26200.1 AlNc14C357G10957 [Albugo laibachii Nc14]